MMETNQGTDIDPQKASHRLQEKNWEVLERELAPHDKSLDFVLGMLAAQHEGINVDDFEYFDSELLKAAEDKLVRGDFDSSDAKGVESAINTAAMVHYGEDVTIPSVIKFKYDDGEEGLEVSLGNFEQLRGYLIAREALGVPSAGSGKVESSTIVDDINTTLNELQVLSAAHRDSMIADRAKQQNFPAALRNSIIYILSKETSEQGPYEEFVLNPTAAPLIDEGSEPIQPSDSTGSALAEIIPIDSRRK